MTPTLMKRSTRALLTAGLLATTPWASQAQPTGDDSQEGRSRWGLGLAVMPEIKPYRDFDGKTEVWPLITFENRWVRAAFVSVNAGNCVGAGVARHRHLSVVEHFPVLP